MIDDTEPLPNIESLVVKARPSVFEGATWPAASPCGVQGQSGDAGSNLEPEGLEGPEGVSPQGPGPFSGLPLGLPSTPAGADPVAPVRLNGHAHPWKPRSPAQVAEFETLWRNLTVPLAAIAKRYQAGERTIQGWRKDFGLPGRDELARAQARGEIAASTGIRVTTAPPETIGSAGYSAATPRPEPSVTGAAPRRPADPLDVPEIAALLAEIGNDARQVTAISDLRPLRRKLTKLTALASASAPHNWSSLHTMAQEQSRALLWAETCEAKLPKAQETIRQLRASAAGQLMHELKSALSEEDQQALAVLVKRGADVLMARGRQASVPNDLPGESSYAHNGKQRPQVKPG